MSSRNFISFVCVLLLYHLTYSQKNIIVKVKEDKISFKNTMDSNDTFHIAITIINNSDHPIKIPPAECGECDVTITTSNNKFFSLITCPLIETPGKRVIEPGSKGDIKMVILKSGYFKGKYKRRFHPHIIDLTTKKLIDVASNKVIIRAE